MTDPAGRRDFLNPLKVIKAFREESTEQELAVPLPESAEVDFLSENCLLYVSKDAMACNWQIYFPPAMEEQATETAIEALELVERLEDQMTVYRDSPLTYLNDQASHEPVRVEANLFRLIQQGIELFEMTDGAFDITAGLLTKAWGFYRKEGRVPDEVEIKKVLQSVGSDKIQMDAEQETVFYQASELEINLGAIGKGYALDRIAEFMTEMGLDHFLVHGGQSSVLSRGQRWTPKADVESPTESPPASPSVPPPESIEPVEGSPLNSEPPAASRTGGGALQESAQQPEAWKVGLRHPLQIDKRIAEIKLTNRSLGTSGTGRQSFYHQGKRYGHIIDPRTGQPAAGVYSATAIAPTAAESDALATAFYIMGGPAATDFCQRYPQYACLVLTPSQKGDVEIFQQNIKPEEIDFL